MRSWHGVVSFPSARSFRRLWRILIGVTILLGFVSQLPAARLERVRVGTHPEFVRVVFETDAPVEFSAPVSTQGRLQTEFFQVDGELPARLSYTNGVKAIDFHRTQLGIQIDISTGSDKVDVVPFTLSHPDRIVFDIYPRKIEPVNTSSQKVPEVSNEAKDTDEESWTASQPKEHPISSSAALVASAGRTPQQDHFLYVSLVAISAAALSLLFYLFVKESRPVPVDLSKLESYQRKIAELDSRIIDQIERYNETEGVNQ